MADELRAFNSSIPEEERNSIGLAVGDVQDFFPNLDRDLLEFVIYRAVFEFREKEPRWNYF